MVGFSTRPLRTTWDNPRPELSYSAEGPDRTACDVADRPVVPFVRLRAVGVRWTNTAFASFNLAQPRYFVVWLPPQLAFKLLF